MLTNILRHNKPKLNDVRIKTEIFEADDVETQFESNETCAEGTDNKEKTLKLDENKCNEPNCDVKIKSEICETDYFKPPTEFQTEEISNDTEIHKVFIKVEDKIDDYIKHEIDEEFILKEDNEQEEFSGIHNVVHQEQFCNQNEPGYSVANKNDSRAAGSMCTYNHDPLQNMETVKCKKCPKTYHNKKDLKIHYRTHTKKSQTKKKSKSRNLAHTDKKSHVCDVCQKSFHRIDIMKRHKLIHNAIQPYQCDVCQKTFSQMGHLKIHKLVHTGERPHVCDVCQKAFKLMCSLQEHKRIHSGEKPYECDVCQKTFRHAGTLIRHKLTHTGDKPHVCDVCQKSFSLPTQLKFHKLVHSNEKSFTCDVCQRAFSRKDYLRKHFKLLHSKEVS